MKRNRDRKKGTELELHISRETNRKSERMRRGNREEGGGGRERGRKGGGERAREKERG